ncbi:MAG: restriction endonuclease subunit S [Aeriscardovia sp.]|nr:restriction endonuclease subunit S [Aeriscardovia sp.]
MSRLSELIAELCPDGVEYKALGDIEDEGRIKLGRGKVISKKAIAATPGDYPIYSSAATNEGLFGKYGKWMFDDTRITWSVDGGGKFFYRQGGRRYSVTNVCGWMQVASEEIDAKYLYYTLSNEWSKKVFDYVHKAHPSVIRKEYVLPLPPIEVQREIVRILDSFQELDDALTAEIKARRKQYAYYRDELLKFERERVEYKTLGDVAHTFVGLATSVTKWKRPSGIRLLHNSDIQPNRIVIKNDEFIAPEFAERNKVKRLLVGDVITVHTGAVGTSSVINEEYDGTLGFTTLTARILDKDELSPSYLCHVLNSDYCLAQIAKMSISDRNNLDQKSYNRMLIPIPPLEEQQRIVSILDRFDKLANDLSSGLPAEIEARHQQYEYYRDRLLTFLEKEV